MSTQSCCGLAGRVFGHKFKARFDDNETYPPETAKLLDIALSRVTGVRAVMLPDDVNAISHIVEGFRQVSDTESFYVQDVCVRCGLVVERPTDPVEQTDTKALIEMIGARLVNSGPFERAKFKDALQDLMAVLAKAASQPPTEAESQPPTEAESKASDLFKP